MSADWGLSENNRRARIYKLTRRAANGSRAEREHWDTLVAAIARVLETA